MIHFHNLNKIKETEGNIIEINNFISKKEISKLNDYVKSAKNIWIDRGENCPNRLENQEYHQN